LYPKPNINYLDLKEEILEDKYLQINFDFRLDRIEPSSLFKQYEKLTRLLLRYKVIDQITDEEFNKRLREDKEVF
jgi:hypothetical protein